MEEQAVEVEVPSYFLCPITLDVMRDPVTLPTGITYDRHAIHRWLRLADGATSATCPLTKLPVAPDCEPTPNHTLHRLIHSWCARNPAAAVDSIERISTPPVSANLGPLVSRLADPKKPERETLAALREIRDVAGESEPGRELVAAFPGAADALFAVLVSTSASSEADMALDAISSLRLAEPCLVRAVDRDGMALVDALVSMLQRDADAVSRARAAMLLADVTACMAPSRASSLPEQVFVEAVRLLRDNDGGASTAAIKAALRVLAGATSYGRNRIKAAQAGAVAALVEVLLDVVEGGRRRAWCELALCALDRLCGCAEGRAALVAHAAGVAAVGEMVVGTSAAASGKAVRVLRSVARHAATAEVVREMVATGAVTKLCAVAVSPETQERTKERARETLRMHAVAWRSSPCIHPNRYPC
ncbi:hypothetical protein QYE76_047626 [Lolium multiflorum]|uniref:U-box domain-containing protein n=1 Tax=Lolium multiflorum TaxID=4521 RepID=A0AAD8X252_LOLMU|nr:hypothetical protein QYE76_047626 [Lolium multiflorum]